KMIAEQAGVAQVQLVFAGRFALVRKASSPEIRHLGDSFRGATQSARQGVFNPAVDHPLGGDSLFAAQSPLFKERGVVACSPQSIHQPEPGNTAANKGDIQIEGVSHCTSHGETERKRGGQYKAFWGRGRWRRRLSVYGLVKWTVRFAANWSIVNPGRFGTSPKITKVTAPARSLCNRFVTLRPLAVNVCFFCLAAACWSAVVVDHLAAGRMSPRR